MLKILKVLFRTIFNIPGMRWELNMSMRAWCNHCKRYTYIPEQEDGSARCKVCRKKIYYESEEDYIETMESIGKIEPKSKYY